MATDAQLTANRANSAKSTGPTSAEGKTTSAQNSLTHGLTSKQIVLSHENAAEYEKLKADTVFELQPVGTGELAAVLSMVAAWWRLRRAQAIEAAFLDNRAKAIAKENPELTPEDALSEIFSSPLEMARIRLMMRYVKSAESSHKQAKSDFAGLRRDRLKAQAEAEAAAKLEAQAANGAAQALADDDPTVCPPEILAEIGFVSLDPDVEGFKADIAELMAELHARTASKSATPVIDLKEKRIA